MPVWRRHGLVVTPPASHRWWRNSAGMPTCLPLSPRLWRIWFAGRDEHGRSGVLCADVDPQDGMRVLALREVAGLERGEGDAFDSAGLWVSAALAVEGRVMLWYTGMRLSHDVPHELAIGLAVSEDGGLSFRKVGDGPVLASPPGAPRFVTAPCVVRSGAGFTMWYANGLAWRVIDGRQEPYYDLRRASSGDGVTWTRCDAPVLGLDGTRWGGITRPWIEQDGSSTRLWFSARGGSGFRGPGDDAYRIYCAPLEGDSARTDAIEAVAFAPAPQAGDWDGWMQVASCVVSNGDARVMFYNGNDFSRDGFGYAIEEACAA